MESKESKRRGKREVNRDKRSLAGMNKQGGEADLQIKMHGGL